MKRMPEDYVPFESLDEKLRHNDLISKWTEERECALILSSKPIPVRPGVAPPSG